MPKQTSVGNTAQESKTISFPQRLDDDPQSHLDGISIVAILIAALPWAVISQTKFEPAHFSSTTILTFVTISSGLSVLLALFYQGFKLGLAVGDKVMLALSTRYTQLLLLSMELCLVVSALFLFLTIAAYAFKTGMIFASLVSLGIVNTLVQYPRIFLGRIDRDTG